jgi:hypothetical protein
MRVTVALCSSPAIWMYSGFSVRRSMKVPNNSDGKSSVSTGTAKRYPSQPAASTTARKNTDVLVRMTSAA